MQVVERSSLVSVLFREAFSHPYIFFFSFLVNGFSVQLGLICPESNYLLIIVRYFEILLNIPKATMACQESNTKTVSIVV